MDNSNDNYESDAHFILAQAKEMLGIEEKQKEEKVMICILSGTLTNIKNTFTTIKELMGTQ